MGGENGKKKRFDKEFKISAVKMVTEEGQKGSEVARSLYPLKVICRVLEVSKSGYYAWKRRPKSRRGIDNEALLIEIRRVFIDNDENYGSPRISDAL